MSTFKERLIEGATIVGAVIACVAFGYSIGKDTNDGLVNFLREKSQLAEKTETQLRAEATSLKLELQGSKSIVTPAKTTVYNSAVGVAAVSGALEEKPKADANAEHIILTAGESARPFDGKLIVSLVGIRFEGDPLRHKVSVTVGVPGRDNKTFEKIDVGFASLFNGYEVRLIASDTFSATFLVTKLDSSDLTNHSSKKR